MLSFQLRVMLVCLVVCFVAGVAATMIGRTMALRNFLTFTSWNGMGYEVYVVDVNRRLTISLPDGYSPYQNFYGWSDDGRFAFLSDRDGNTEVYLWDWETMTNISQHAFNDWRPTMARDGRVAFASERDGNMEIYVWDNGTLTNVSQNARYDDFPVWSADGQLAWISDAEGEPEVYVWDGETTVNVSQSPQTTEHNLSWGDGPLMWIADGQPVIAGGYTWDGIDIVPMPISPTNSGMIWSADGRLAYYESSDIYVWDGTQAINVSQTPFSGDYFPAWGADGRLAFTSVGYYSTEIYMWDGVSVEQFTFNDLNEEGLIWTP